ncbi:MAG: hypothetical protein LC753_18840 [Acidobacteria bacterium]|nr:hypothetical protein [Acidobacteriota bacterium]MCA1652223.1 hypothetical protein [Acidobacteriota bacterium]
MTHLRLSDDRWPVAGRFASTVVLALAVWFVTTVSVGVSAQQTAAPLATPQLSDTEIEAFLRDAKVLSARSTGKGVTDSLRATLSNGAMTHDAHIQTIDEEKREFRTPKIVEFNFRDSWKFNIAAYKLDRMLGLNMVPVSVPRRWRMQQAAYTWWVDDVMMDEGDRLKGQANDPDVLRWNRQMQLVRVFDQLIYNTDRNLGNLLITKEWRVWAIDHTRAFRKHETLKTPAALTACDRQLLEKLKALDRQTLKRELDDYLLNWEIDGLLKRRDAIVAHFEKLGPAALFDRAPAR